MTPLLNSKKYHLEDEPYFDNFYDQNVAVSMTVPKKIKITGIYSDDEEDELSNHISSYNGDKIDMRVPDRILVLGQNQHAGADKNAPPREIEIENTIMPPDPTIVRVLTPPRVLTLEDHYFPSAADDFYVEDPSQNAFVEPDIDLDLSKFGKRNGLPSGVVDLSRNVDVSMELSRTMSPLEEIAHLRKQLSRMNRRLVHVECQMMEHSQQRRLLLGIAISYFLYKGFLWISRP